MPWVKIPNVVATSFVGKNFQVARKDDDGEVVWKEPCVLCGSPKETTEPERKDARPADLISDVLLSLNNLKDIRAVQKADDGQRALRLWNQVENSKGGDYLRINEKEYEWLKRLLNRVLPKEGDKKDDQAVSQTVAQRLWSLNAWTLQRQLMSVDERASEQEPEPE